MLLDLTEGRLTPEQASDWATPWLTEEAGEVHDDLVWDAIGALAGADMLVAPSTFLYGPLDFQAWLDDFDAGRA
ncbi:hypothetical protein ACIOD2_39405 [Amycolatopsis sp. NPDC088138]|uniref:hypothetical protein n=1 Tax=Amycolatopsis sp. NPDC088138 TaxID=3363938 RepID=UPI003829F2E8